jgi:ketosteroid isomerase-like protein
MSMAVSNAATIGKIYEAFGRGDVPFILSQLADDVAWESWADNSAQKAGVPWMQGGTGRDAAGAFFQAIASWVPSKFEVVSVAEAGNTVFAEIEAGFTVGNGKSFEDNEIHLWKFNEAGQVSLFRHYLDTAKHIETAK